jgi:hypothetical protein
VTYCAVDEYIEQLLQDTQPTEVTILLAFFPDPRNPPSPRFHAKFVGRPRPVILQIAFTFHRSTFLNAISGGFEGVPGTGLHKRRREEKETQTMVASPI